MELITFPISDLKLIKLKSFHDDRGFFTERFNYLQFSQLGLPTAFVQDNFSRSKYGVLRGLHFQIGKGQGKLITCLNGEIFDVAVDLRKDSATYRQHVSIHLSGNDPSWFWIPSGFAHGFYVTSKEGADVLYKVDSYYSAENERAIRWDHPSLNISWPIHGNLIIKKEATTDLF